MAPPANQNLEPFSAASEQIQHAAVCNMLQEVLLSPQTASVAVAHEKKLLVGAK